LSIPVVIAMISPAVTVITSIRSTVTVVEAHHRSGHAALGLLGIEGYSKGMLQLLALPHGICLASRWNWHWSSMTMLKSPLRKVDGLGGSAM
jgi:hypothetical protein